MRSPVRQMTLILIAVVATTVGTRAGAETVHAETSERQARLIFTWPEPVGHRLITSNDRAILSFSSPSVGAVDAAARQIGSLVSKVRRSGDGKVVIFDLAGGVTAVSRAQANDVVIEFSAPAAKTPGQSATAPKNGKDRVAVSVQAVGPGTRLAFDWPQAVGYTVAPDRQGVVVVFDKTGTLDLAAHADAIKQAGVTVATLPAAGKLVVKLGVPPEMLVRDRRDGYRISFDIVPSNTAAALPNAADDHRASAKLPGTTGVTLAVVSDAAGLTLAFEWPVRVAAAAFRRGEHIWVVFPRGAELDLAELRARLGNGVTDVERIAAGDALALRFAAAPEVGLQLRRDGLEWTLTFQPRPLTPRTVVSVRAEPAVPPGGSVFVRSGAGGPVLRLVDPEFGVHLFVAPNHAAGVGLDSVRDFPKFRLLPTVQGTLIEPKADGLAVSAGPDGVEITHGLGLALSEPSQ
ncbi:MAG: hypothetical protein AB7G15_13500 [Alphaproteobacteria bacterium]